MTLILSVSSLSFSLLLNLGNWNDTIMILIDGPEKDKLEKTQIVGAITRTFLLSV